MSESMPECAVSYLVRHINHDMLTLIEPIFADAELGFTQWCALNSIGGGAGATCAAVANDIGHDVGATSRMLGKLEERKLVSRDRSKVDRRVVHLSLTDTGGKIAALYKARLADHWNRWLVDWPQADRESLLLNLQRLRVTLTNARSVSP